MLKVIDFDELEDDEYDRCLFEGVPITGIAVEYHPSGRLWSEVHFVEGIKDGLTKEWYEDGHLSSEKMFRRGGLSGPSRTWHCNGQVSMEATYEHGICLERKGWDEEGSPSFEYRLQLDHSDFNYTMLEIRRSLAKARDEATKSKDGAASAASSEVP